MTVPFQPCRATLPRLRQDSDAWSVARIVGSRIDGLCMVAGVCAEGARLMSVLALAVGDEITLDFGGDARFPARVRWVEGAVAGIGFVAAAQAGDGAEGGSAADRAAARGDRAEAVRQPPRFRRCVPVTLERHGREQPGELVDISQFGACIAAPAQPWLRLGSGVVLAIDGCDAIDAEVRWHENGRIGLAFHSHVQLWKLDKRLQEWAQTCDDCERPECDGDRRQAARAALPIQAGEGRG